MRRLFCHLFPLLVVAGCADLRIEQNEVLLDRVYGEAPFQISALSLVNVVEVERRSSSLSIDDQTYVRMQLETMCAKNSGYFLVDDYQSPKFDVETGTWTFYGACVGRPEGLGFDAFRSLSGARSAAEMEMAKEIASNCAKYKYNELVRDLLVIEMGGIPGLRSTLEEMRSIQIAGSVSVLQEARKDFGLKHGIILGVSDTCSAIDAEIAEVSGMSVLFELA